MKRIFKSGKKSKILRLISFITGVVAVLAVGAQFTCCITGISLSSSTRKAYKDSADYIIQCETKAEEIKNKVESNEMTEKEGERELKDYCSSDNIDNLIKSGNNKNAQVALQTSDRLLYANWSLCGAFNVLNITRAITSSKAKKYENEEEDLDTSPEPNMSSDGFIDMGDFEFKL